MKLTEATWVTKETEVDLLNIPGRDWPEEIKQIAYYILRRNTDIRDGIIEATKEKDAVRLRELKQQLVTKVEKAYADQQMIMEDFWPTK